MRPVEAGEEELIKRVVDLHCDTFNSALPDSMRGKCKVGYWDGNPESVGGRCTLTDVEEFPYDIWLAPVDSVDWTTVDDNRVRRMLAVVVEGLGKDGMYEAVVKSMRAVDKLACDMWPITVAAAESAMDKASYSVGCTASRMCELYEAVEGSDLENRVARDLGAMLPGLVFMVMWKELLYALITGYGDLDVYSYDSEKTLEDITRVYSDKIVDYACKLRRVYGEGASGAG